MTGCCEIAFSDRKQMDRTVSGMSPSGLFTRAAWERDLESSHAVLPRWTRSAAERDRRFLEWVDAEALGLSAHLGRLRRPGASPRVTVPLDTLLRALAEDAAWARRELAGRLSEAA
jgi:hypothetical protein